MAVAGTYQNQWKPGFLRKHVFRLYLMLTEKLFLRSTIRMIRQSAVFDEADYLERYPEVRKLGMSAITHFLLYGRYQQRRPGADFFLCFEVEDEQGRDRSPLRQWIRQIRGGKPSVRLIPFREAVGLMDKRNTTTQEILTSEIADPSIVYKAYIPVEDGADYQKQEVISLPSNDIRLIAFYLTQFHPFPENDRFWGRGFTEWTNTSKAQPLYQGHYQPRLPGELGFYDTRVKEVMMRQMELARQHGVYGFCLHHYFFDGKPLMRVPFDQIMKHPDLDLPFCLHWANEPWTAKFDGYADRGGILMAQNHYPEDDILFFRDVEAALHDPRYIKVDGRPLLIVYRPGLFPDFRKTVERWRECAVKSGLPGIYMAMVETIFEGVLDPATYGVDAVVEFPPHYIRHINALNRVTLFDPGFKGEIYSYPDVVEGELVREKPDYTLFRGIFPQWDNTARRRDPKIFHGAEPHLYQQWLEYLIGYTQKNLPADRQLIFLNAWNEWAEAAYIEPDRRYGYTYLNATSRAFMNALSKGNVRD